MATIIDGLRDLVSPAILSALSRQTGESESAVSRGLSAAIPAIASTVAGRADDQGFVKRSSGSRHHDGCRASSARGHQCVRVLANGHRYGKPDRHRYDKPVQGMAVRPVWSQPLRGHRQHRSVCWNQRSIGHIAPLNRRAARRSPTSGDWCEATISASLVLPTCSGAQRARLASSLPTGFKMPEVFSAPYEKARTAGNGEDRLVGSAHRAAGCTLCRWTDLVGPPEARRSGSCGHH